MYYEKMAKDYYLHRRISNTIKSQILSEIDFFEKNTILDFGCGTGNYAYYLKNFENINLFGVDSSKEMLNFFQKKNPDVYCFLGDEKHTPFLDNTFDYIYMIDVIHHISNIDILFKEISRILKSKGKVCICTENRKQLEDKYWLTYFPSIIKYDLKRFWKIEDIISFSSNRGFNVIKITETMDITNEPISSFFMKQIESKAMSVLHLISENEYEMGVKQMKEDYLKGKIVHHTRGYTFIWLKKE